MRALRSLAAAALVALCSSCGGDATGGGLPPRQPVITSGEFIASGEGVLTGLNLDVLPPTIHVDGQAVVVTARSESRITFVMPPPAACEVDGRPVSLSAGETSFRGRLTVASVLRLQPGESRVLRDLADLCLQLPADDQSFVFTALNPVLTEGIAPTPLFTLHALTGAAAASATLARLPQAEPGPGWRAQPPRSQSGAGQDRYQVDPVEFDPRYATAGPGDTVTWVDFRSPQWYTNSGICSEPRSHVPTFPAVVAAQSPSGRGVIAFDARTTNPALWNSAEVRARLTRVAEIADRWTIPAVREVFDPGFEPVRGGDGRWWHIFTTTVSLPTVDQAGLPQSMCTYYSEVATTLSPDAPPTHDGQIEPLAGYLVHEYAHHAEDVIAVRRWGDLFGRGSPGWGAIAESWAQNVQETAARLASGQLTAARHDPLVAGSGIPYPDFYLTGYGERPDLSPWSGGRGPYDQGARLLLFLREQWGDATIGSTAVRFYQRALALPTYDFASLAGLAGMEPAMALDRWSLAEATDDLVAPDVVAARGLPQIRSWVPHDRAPAFQLSRGANAAFPIKVAHGGYAALYFPPDAGKGVSLTFSGFSDAKFVARITRLR